MAISNALQGDIEEMPWMIAKCLLITHMRRTASLASRVRSDVLYVRARTSVCSMMPQRFDENITTGKDSLELGVAASDKLVRRRT